jgi:CxxC-x17-CxxC domain-containing protein
MGNFKQIGGKRFGKKREGGFAKRDGERSFSAANSGGGDWNRRPVTMHQTTCAECGKPCEVPFRPIGDKPLYCQDCFRDKRNDGERNGGYLSQKDWRASSFAKPGFRNNATNGGNNELISQLKTLNAKIDRLIVVVEAIAGKGSNL